MNREFFREKVKNKTIIVGLTSLAVLFVVADTIGDMISTLADSGGSVNRAIHSINKNMSKSLSVSDYLEILKEASGVNLANTIHRLKKKGLISKSRDNYSLTPLGKQFVDKFKKQNQDRLHWDGKWRLISFDVPEKRRRDRNWLRAVLRSRAYKQLHRSVFLGKYSLPEDIYREIYKKKLASFIHALTVGEIDDESKFF